MPRYADIDVLLEHLTTSDEGNFRTAITQWLEMHQVEDVAPVIHARWVKLSVGETWYCSECKRKFPPIYINDNYCPHCGAKMDEEVEYGVVSV